jgi:ribonuclease HIII
MRIITYFNLYCILLENFNYYFIGDKNNINEIGLDEAGRGPLIGRVYAGAVIWEQEKECDIIKDSKKLALEKNNEILYLEYLSDNYTNCNN